MSLGTHSPEHSLLTDVISAKTLCTVLYNYHIFFNKYFHKTQSVSQQNGIRRSSKNSNMCKRQKKNETYLQDLCYSYVSDLLSLKHQIVIH